MPARVAEPPQIRDPNTLAQEFRDRFEPWREAANAWLAKRFGAGKANILIVETFRTKARQDWLWMQGRVKGYGVFGKPVTWTMWSAHRLGLAVDVTPQVLNGVWVARWDLLDDLFTAVPPEKYGMERIPSDAPHLQMAGMLAKTNVVYAQERGLRWDKPQASRWPR